MLINLKAFSSTSPGEVNRASVTPLSDSVPPGALPSVPAPPSAPSAMQMASGAKHVAAVTLPSAHSPLLEPTKTTPQKNSGGAKPIGKIAVALGLVAVAAGAFLAVRSLRTEPAAPVAVNAPPNTAQMTAHVEMAPLFLK